MTSDQLRERFDQWVREKTSIGSISDLSLHRELLEMGWEAWQASARSSIIEDSDFCITAEELPAIVKQIRNLRASAREQDEACQLPTPMEAILRDKLRFAVTARANAEERRHELEAVLSAMLRVWRLTSNLPMNADPDQQPPWKEREAVMKQAEQVLASARESQPARKTLNPDELANSLMSLVLDGGFTYPRDRERVRKQMAFIIHGYAREAQPAPEESCATCGASMDATVHKVERYRRVPGGYGHPFVGKSGRARETVNPADKEQA